MSETAMQPQGAYYDFRAAIDAMAEKVGGDACALCAAENIYADVLSYEVRRNETGDRQHSALRTPYAASWVRATEEDFVKAAEKAAAKFVLPEDGWNARVIGRKFTVAWTPKAIYRHPNGEQPTHGILLAHTIGLEITITEEGCALAGSNRRGFAKRFRRYKSQDAVIGAFGNFANWEFKS